MDGPSHYVEAERLIETVVGPEGKFFPTGDSDPEVIALANAHATLALAAATGCAGTEVQRQAWLDVAG